MGFFSLLIAAVLSLLIAGDWLNGESPLWWYAGVSLFHGFFASIIQVKLRDLHAIWTLALQVLMYATPIIYPITILPEKMRKFVELNPLTILMENSRSALLNLPSPSLSAWLICSAGVIVFFFAGMIYFQKNVKKVAEFI